MNVLQHNFKVGLVNFAVVVIYHDVSKCKQLNLNIGCDKPIAPSKCSFHVAIN